MSKEILSKERETAPGKSGAVSFCLLAMRGSFIDFDDENCYVSILVIEEEVSEGVVSLRRVSLMARSHILKVMDDWLE